MITYKFYLLNGNFIKVRGEDVAEITDEYTSKIIGYLIKITEYQGNKISVGADEIVKVIKKEER